jgi:hypothetical protein
MEYNIYCDESCHLEKCDDDQRVMVLGALWCPKEKREQISKKIREIKAKYGLKTGITGFEIKWVKVSPARLDFYSELLNYFFDDDDLHFRALIIPDKRQLRHPDFHQTHDDWYYKMYYYLLTNILHPRDRYYIYIDIKDTRSNEKVTELKTVLRNKVYDFDHAIIRRIQQIRSHESEILQLADLIIGAISYTHRHLDGSPAKTALASIVKERSGYSLMDTTLPSENKMNIFVWKPSHVGNSGQ